MKTSSPYKPLLLTLVALSLTVLPAQAGKGRWQQHTGKGYLMCDAMFKELKRHDFSKTKSETSCAIYQVLPQAKSFRRPEWKKLDPNQYRPLLRRIFASDYWRLDLPEKERGWLRMFNDDLYQPDSFMDSLTNDQKDDTEKRIDKFIASGKYLQVWSMPLPAWLEEEARRHDISTTPLTFVQFAGPFPEPDKSVIKDECKSLRLPMPDILTWELVLVNDSLTGLEPRAIPRKNGTKTFFSSVIREAARKSDVYLYKGTPYFIGGIFINIISLKYRKWLFEPSSSCDIFYSTIFK